MEQPKFSLQDFSFYASDAIFLRGQHLAKTGAVKDVTKEGIFYEGKVKGSSSFYHVFIHEKDIEKADCDCYMGQNEKFCKHIVALGVEVFKLSGKIEKPSPKLIDLKEVRLAVNKGIRCIKPYEGPSSKWFAYQRMLDQGSNQIEQSIQDLPATEKNLCYLWELVLKLSDKLACGGIDDSDGRVGGCIDEIAQKCIEMVKEEPSLLPFAQVFARDDTGFCFEDVWKQYL